MMTRFVSSALLLLWSLASTQAGTSEEGLAWLKENAKKEGVIELPSGLQYKVLKPGSGSYHPGPGTRCSCHYAGTLTDGTQFDSSYDRGEPTTFAPNQVIKGWTEAMQFMTEGQKVELYIPSELGYGDRGSPPKIPGGAVLVFTMELLEILDMDSAVMALKCSYTTGEDCNERETTFIAKVKDSWNEAKVESELKRINKMLENSGNSKEELVDWMNRRVFILEQVGGTKSEEL